MPPVLRALFALLLACGLTLIELTRFHPPSPWLPALAAGVLAAGFGAVFGLQRWWWWLLAAFPVAALGALQLDLPPWLYGVAAGLLAATYGSVHRTRVPLFLSRRAVWDRVSELLPPPAPERRLRFVDLGSAFGGLPRHIARRRPDADCLGVEAAPLPAWLGILRQRLRPVPGATLRRGDLWTTPLHDVDLAFAFLSPVPMPELWRKVQLEMRPGTLFVSCEFPVPTVEPLRVLADGHRPLYVYQA